VAKTATGAPGAAKPAIQFLLALRCKITAGGAGAS